MAIREPEIKLLWGRAAGICSNPNCRRKLSHDEDADNPFIIGEMAHVVAKSLGGPRAAESAGADIYDNLILLCPTCHTLVDKHADAYPRDLLIKWKTTHENWVSESLSDGKEVSLPEMATKVLKLLHDNHYYFKKYGPGSEVAESKPESNVYALWIERRLDTIVPNNKEIISMISKHAEELDRDGLDVFMDFKDHAISYEKHIYSRMEDYPKFPVKFVEYIERISHERK